MIIHDHTMATGTGHRGHGHGSLVVDKTGRARVGESELICHLHCHSLSLSLPAAGWQWQCGTATATVALAVSHRMCRMLLIEKRANSRLEGLSMCTVKTRVETRDVKDKIQVNKGNRNQITKWFDTEPFHW